MYRKPMKWAQKLESTNSEEDGFNDEFGKGILHTL